MDRAQIPRYLPRVAEPPGGVHPVLLEPSADQEFFRETTDRFLTEQVPVGELRRLRDDPVGFADRYWTGGADLGWSVPVYLRRPVWPKRHSEHHRGP